MSETRFDIVSDDDFNTFLSVTSKDDGIQLLVTVDRDDVEQLRDALPEQPPTDDNNEETE